MMQKNSILTHRGLAPSRTNFFSESSWEAFHAYLSAGLGIEFDACLVKDEMVVHHDLTLAKVTDKKDLRALKDITAKEFHSLPLKQGRTCTLRDVLTLITQQTHQAISALHFKGPHQTPRGLNDLIQNLLEFPQCFKNLFIFDLKLESARYIKKRLPEISLGVSLVHPYDQERFNKLTDGTLYTFEEVRQHRELFHWAVLDEWDLKDRHNEWKKLYTPLMLERIRNLDLKSMIISPELHKNDGHEDSPSDRLFQRMKEIISLEPDLICTDYPDELAQLKREIHGNI